MSAAWAEQGAPAPPSLPLVVQVGFAGSRRLLAPDEAARVDVARFEGEVQSRLASVLADLPRRLRLTSQHFLCGISQVAMGGDLLFTRACQGLGVAQRIFLPQPRDGYFEALDSQGQRDFPGASGSQARAQLDSPHVIQERVVSDAADRHERFEDVNLEIARVSDVVICLVRADAAAKVGGTLDLKDRALTRGRPVLELTLGLGDDGLPTMTETWHRLEAFGLPGLPHDVQGVVVLAAPLPGRPPAAAEVVERLKTCASGEATERRLKFVRGALAVVLAHVVATAMAASALAGAHEPAKQVLLGLELALLAVGFGIHHVLHRSHVARSWALFRLVAEVARSVAAVGRGHLYLSHLFTVSLPQALRPLLRTLNVLHLSDTCRLDCPPWRGPGMRRSAYLRKRLSGRGGQLHYYGLRRATAERGVRWARHAFRLCWGIAFAATTIKLLSICNCCPPTGSLSLGQEAMLGVLGILFPLLAVAALSVTVLLDYEANAHVYAEMGDYLHRQRRHIKACTSEREFTRLVLETETRLLSETASWFSRRFFTSVT